MALRAIISLGLLALLVMAAVPALAHEDASDWMYAEVELPVAVDGFRFQLTTFFESEVPELVYVRGYAFADFDSLTARVIRQSGGVSGFAVGPVSETWTTQPVEGEGFGLGGAYVTGARLPAGALVRAFVALPGATVSGAIVGVEANGAFYPATVTLGSGSGLVRMTEPGVGVAFADGEKFRGVTSVTRHFDAPVLGSLVRHGCTPDQLQPQCKSAWTRPDGASGTWTQGGDWGGGMPVFDGPAGEWTFSWEGLAEFDAFVAYAPVGEWW